MCFVLKNVDLTSDFRELKQFPGYYVNRDGLIGKKIGENTLRIYESNRKSHLLQSSDGKQHRVQESHAVASAFIDDYNDNCRIYFRDGNPRNSRLSNLYIHKEDVEDLDDEVWRKIPGFSDYEMSSKKRVRSLTRTQTVCRSDGIIYERKLQGRILSTSDGGHFMMTPDGAKATCNYVSNVYKMVFGD